MRKISKLKDHAFLSASVMYSKSLFICLKHTAGTSLVVQGLRICFPVQGMQVQSLVGEL